MEKKRHGLLLLNLGTPDSPIPKDVGKYLREFLMDPWVIDIPFFARWFLVNVLIVPKRSKDSAKLYQKIWTERGSPLLFHLVDLSKKVQTMLGESWVVVPGMRYGKPSLKEAFQRFKNENVQKIIVLPLYPQYSLAATESSIQKCRKISEKLTTSAQLSFVSAFYLSPLFIKAFANQVKKSLREFASDYVLFSFHGLPERQILNSDMNTANFCQFNSDCCSRMEKSNRNCYRAQCYETARRIAAELNLDPAKYGVSFQSRLGRDPWIKPYTDFVYEELPGKGVKRLLVVSPSFVGDCLETLEEIQIRGKAQFIGAGGQDLKLVPSLNSTDDWVKAVCNIVAP